MLKKIILLAIFGFATQAVYSQYFTTTFTYNASTGLLNFYIKPTGGNIATSIGEMQFDITYPIGSNINFGTITNNTVGFPGLNVVYNNSFTLNGEWVYSWNYLGPPITSQDYAQNTEYWVFSVQLSGTGTTTLQYKSNYPNFDPVFTINDDLGTPLWDDMAPHDVYYPGQQSSGDYIYIALTVSLFPLPLELSHFEVVTKQKSIQLNWIAQNLQNFDGFEIQRSIDGMQFSKITFVKGENNLDPIEYTYLDNDINTGALFYYRLKMIDLDGSFTYSKIQSASIEDAIEKINILSNPATEVLCFRVTLTKDDYLNAKIFDINGRLMNQFNSALPSGTSTLNLDLMDLKNGVYFIAIESTDGIFSDKFIKTD